MYHFSSHWWLCSIFHFYYLSFDTSFTKEVTTHAVINTKMNICYFMAVCAVTIRDRGVCEYFHSLAKKKSFHRESVFHCQTMVVFSNTQVVELFRDGKIFFFDIYWSVLFCSLSSVCDMVVLLSCIFLRYINSPSYFVRMFFFSNTPLIIKKP